MKEARLEQQKHAPPRNLQVSIRQPDKMTLQPWPDLPYVRGWIQQTRQAWRVLTAGGDHAEAYLQAGIDAAKAKSDAEFDATLESLQCNVEAYAMAEEKVAVELCICFPQSLQRDLSIVRERRLREGRGALLGRQLLAWALRRYCKDEVRDRNTARKAMASLLAAVRRTPPARAAFDRLVQAIRGNLAMEGGEELKESETLDILESTFDALPDFKSGAPSRAGPKQQNF